MNTFREIRSNPKLPAYVGVPSDEPRSPVVIIFMHRPGVDKPMRKVVDDLVKAGFAAVCFDVYRGGILENDYTDFSVFEDFEATMNFVKNELENVDPSRIGVLGFCMGGRHAYLAAARYAEQLNAVVSFYGFPARGQDESDTPIHLVDKMECPVLGIFGKQDHTFPFGDVEKFQEKLLTSKPQYGSHLIKVYDDVGHGFLNPFSSRYGDGKSAQLAWNETIEFYKRYL
ncbi:MAG: dienelactone hydrolase family protein [Candidatus Heimdallarchaeota archaeon]